MITETQLKKIEEAKKNGKKVGLVQGSWDLFHLGHLLYIKKARELSDYLVIGMDSDEKIRKRKGNSRPIIPEEERYEFIKLLELADDVIIKDSNEKKWELIKTIKPDVLIAIKENYTDEEIKKLNEICGKVAILPRQSESSTSDKIRKIMISNQKNKIDNLDSKMKEAIEKVKERINFNKEMTDPIPRLIKHLEDSTDWICPVAAACYHDGRWYLGANHSDFNIPKFDVENRTELYYATTEHAEINLLKKLGNVEKINTPIWTTLFPCDKCMKVLIDKGVKEIFYLEDHPHRNWSKRSHELAEKHGIKTINLLQKEENEQKIESTNYKYIYPANAREQEQLDIMMEMEEKNIDPLAPETINQEILFTTNYWYISRNRFPYEGVEHQFLIVSKYPVYRIEDMSNEMWEELENIWQKITIDYNIPGGALCFRFGEPSLSGATLKRLHAHIIMPKSESKTKFNIGGHKTLKKGLYLKTNNNN